MKLIDNIWWEFFKNREKDGVVHRGDTPMKYQANVWNTEPVLDMLGRFFSGRIGN